MSYFAYVNFYETTLSAALSSTATSMNVSTASGLPSSLASGEIIPIVLTSASSNAVHEIVYITAISGTTLTITRGEEGTSALSWSIGDYVACGTTAGSVGTSTGVYDIAGGVSGPIAGSQYVLFFNVVRAINVPANFAGSISEVLTAFTSAATFTIYHNGTSVGTISFAASGTVGTFSTSSAFTMAVGDNMTIQAPSTADATAANLAITILANLA